MDDYNEHLHTTTGEPVSVDRNIADLMACAAELIAMYSDGKERKHVLKEAQAELARLTRERRATGRYPGGPGQTPISGEIH
jgi:hypothetical protein